MNALAVEKGSFITSQLKPMGRWGWGKTRVRSFLELLQKDKMIVKKTDHKKTTISIVNYGIYQEQPNHRQTTSKPRANHSRTQTRMKRMKRMKRKE